MTVEPYQEFLVAVIASVFAGVVIIILERRRK